MHSYPSFDLLFIKTIFPEFFKVLKVFITSTVDFKDFTKKNYL